MLWQAVVPCVHYCVCVYVCEYAPICVCRHAACGEPSIMLHLILMLLVDVPVRMASCLSPSTGILSVTTRGYAHSRLFSLFHTLYSHIRTLRTHACTQPHTHTDTRQRVQTKPACSRITAQTFTHERTFTLREYALTSRADVINSCRFFFLNHILLAHTQTHIITRTHTHDENENTNTHVHIHRVW